MKENSNRKRIQSARGFDLGSYRGFVFGQAESE